MASSAVENFFEDEEDVLEDVLEDFFLVLPDEDELLELIFVRILLYLSTCSVGRIPQ